MLIQFQNMRGRPTLRGTSDQPSALRGGAISPRNPSFLSRCCSALIDIAAVASGILLLTATGVGFTVAIYFLLFCKF